MKKNVKMRSMILAAIVALMPVASALAGDSDNLKVLGFTPDAGYFAYITYGEYDGSGFPHAELAIYDMVRGKLHESLQEGVDPAQEYEAPPPGSGNVSLGKLEAKSKPMLDKLNMADRGTELYKSGTAKKTSFAIDGIQYKLEIKKVSASVNEIGLPEEKIQVVLQSGLKKTTVYSGGGGYDYSINSVLLSQGNKAIGIFLKHSEPGFEGPNRRFLFVPVRL